MTQIDPKQLKPGDYVHYGRHILQYKRKLNRGYDPYVCTAIMTTTGEKPDTPVINWGFNNDALYLINLEEFKARLI